MTEMLIDYKKYYGKKISDEEMLVLYMEPFIG